MTTIEREALPTFGPSGEAPVFASAGNRRAQRLWAVALVAAGFVGLWMVGVGVGMLGFDGLPGASLPALDRISGGGENRERPGVAERGTARTVATPVRAVAPALRTARSTQVNRAQRAEQRRVAAQRRRSPARPVAAPPPAQLQTPPTTLRQGWARDGSTAPPGQTRKAEVAPPPPTVPGVRGQGREEHGPITPVTPPAPENQNPKK